MKTELKKYEENAITFELIGNEVKVNATEMAKQFGANKEPKHWLNTKSAQIFIETLSEVRILTSADLVEVRKSGKQKQQGTFFHADVACEFARWLHPRFAIWTNDMIKELTKGKVEILDKNWIALAMKRREKHIVDRRLVESFHLQQKEVAKLLTVSEKTITQRKKSEGWELNNQERIPDVSITHTDNKIPEHIIETILDITTKRTRKLLHKQLKEVF